jgi:tripartite-type tricarboxylate transporter receptor subunit TctC
MKRFVQALGALAIGAALAGPAAAQQFPTKPVKFLVGFAAGGPTDLAARFIAEGMSPSLGQPVVVENRPGASGQLAHDALKTSPADGYTFSFFMTPTIVSTIVSGKSISTAEITSIGGIYDSVFIVLTNPNAPLMANVRTLKDLIDVVKANPGKVNYTSAGPGSTGHLFGARIGVAEKLQWEHIGYKGIGPASTDLMAGRVAVAFGNFPNDVQFIKEGKLRAIVTSGAQRMPRYPSAPALTETGYGNLGLGTWNGLAGPAGMPKGVTERLTAALRAFFDKKDLVEKVALHFPEPTFQSAEAFEKRAREDIEAISKVVKEAGIKPE